MNNITETIPSQQTTGSPIYDYADTVKTIDAMFDDGDLMELRVIKKNGKIANLFFTNKTELLSAVKIHDIDPNVGGIYTIFNKINPESRTTSTKPGTTAEDILYRRKLILDFDAIKPTGTPALSSSTDAEKAETIVRAGDCIEWLHNNGIPQEPLWGDSGNGTHVIYNINLPNDQESYALISALYDRLNKEDFSVDVSLKDAPRICKLYGTVARKGNDTPERPYRRSHLLNVPSPWEVVTKEQLVSIINIPADGDVIIHVPDKRPLYTMPETDAGGRHPQLKSLVCSMVARKNKYSVILAACRAHNLEFTNPKEASVLDNEVASIYGWAVGEETKRGINYNREVGEIEVVTSNTVDLRNDESFEITSLPHDNLIRMYVEYGCTIQDAYPEFHLANILTLLSYTTPAKMEMAFDDVWNNVWMFVFGKAGQSGKSTTQSLLANVYKNIVGITKPDMLPNKVTPERLTQLMSECNTRLWMVDEASGFMKNMKRDYASENTELILKMYSHTEISKSTVAHRSRDGDIIDGGTIRCEQPHVGMCWYTTPEMFAKHASHDLFDNGFYMRPMYLLPMRIKTVMEDRGRTPDDITIFKSIVASVNELYTLTGGREIKFVDNPIISRWKHGIRISIANDASISSMKGGGQTRSFEHARKIAMLITIGSREFVRYITDNPPTETNKIITCEIPDWAARIAISWSAKFYRNYERALILASSSNGGAYQTIIKTLEAGNGWIPKLELQDSVKKYGKSWDEISNILLVEGIIEEKIVSQIGRGKPRTMYRLLQPQQATEMAV